VSSATRSRLNPGCSRCGRARSTSRQLLSQRQRRQFLINASKSLNTVQRSKAFEMVGLLRCRRPGDVQRFSDR
jgi:hypothetical protein